MQKNSVTKDGFLHTDGRKMIDGEGQEIILKGWGVGNWFNPEGFMLAGSITSEGFSPYFQVPQRYDRGRSMDMVIQELCGYSYAKDFWPRWYENFFSEGDIYKMAQMGCNSVRLPISARAFLMEEPGIMFNEHSFSILNRIIDLCEKYGLYAILDMHAAVGGQSGAACDDGVDNQVHMFTDEESEERTIRLWEELCKRYRDHKSIGAYDLLNEPISLPDQQKYVPQLRLFYERLIERIRAIDPNHMLSIEGNAFSADNRVFFGEPFDPDYNNWCIHFHQYGYSPEVRSLYKYLERSISLNVPLWLGETRGSLPNMTVYYNICESLGIGFNLWSWKVADADPEERDGAPFFGGCPCNFPLPEGWHTVRRYITYGSKRPTYQHCIKMFDALLESVKFENCRKDENIFSTVMRFPGTTVPAAGYDYGTYPGETFSGNWPYGNPFSYRTEDCTKLILRPGKTGPLTGPTRDMLVRSNTNKELLREFAGDPLRDLMLELNENDFAEYTFRSAGKDCELIIAFSVPKKAAVEVSAGGSVLATVSLAPTPDGCLTVKLQDINLPYKFSVRIKCVAGMFHLSSIACKRSEHA